MKQFVPLVFLFLVSGVNLGTGCNLNDVLNSQMESVATRVLQKAKITCTDINARGALVTCPYTYTATSCSCGMACGSWDIRSDTTCHCQCAKIDWTSARCCKIALN